ncbi:MAG: hypothetical protein Q9168_007654 [Polycauliona sp. 1 TL-2023]
MQLTTFFTTTIMVTSALAFHGPYRPSGIPLINGTHASIHPTAVTGGTAGTAVASTGFFATGATLDARRVVPFTRTPTPRAPIPAPTPEPNPLPLPTTMSTVPWFASVKADEK